MENPATLSFEPKWMICGSPNLCISIRSQSSMTNRRIFSGSLIDAGSQPLRSTLVHNPQLPRRLNSATISASLVISAITLFAITSLAMISPSRLPLIDLIF